MGSFDVGQSDRTLGSQIVAQHFRGSLGHVAEHLVQDPVVSALEGQYQQVRPDFTQQGLDAPIIRRQQMFEHEHALADLLRQIRGLLGQSLQQMAVGCSLEGVDDVGGDLDASQPVPLAWSGACQLVLQQLVQGLQRVLRNPVEIGDAQDHFAAQRLRQEVDDLRRLPGFEMRQDDGDDLGMLRSDRLGDGARIAPLHRFQALPGRGSSKQPIDHDARPGLPQGMRENAANLLLRLLDHRSFGCHACDECIQYGCRRCLTDSSQISHGHAQPLDLLGRHQAQHRRSVLLFQREQQHGSAITASQRLIGLSHHEAIQSRTSAAVCRGWRAARARAAASRAS